MSRFSILSSLLLALAVAIPSVALAQPAKPVLTLKTSAEDGKLMIVATVKLNGKPLAGAKVALFATRTFGMLPLGMDETLDDGTAAVPFPGTLPGDTNGAIQVVATITAPKEYTGVQASAMLAGGLKRSPEIISFPRALWAPRAPWPLILTIVALLCSVWGIYGYVVLQLSKIRKESNS
jgi:hypothetical protein